MMAIVQNVLRFVGRCTGAFLLLCLLPSVTSAAANSDTTKRVVTYTSFNFKKLHPNKTFVTDTFKHTRWEEFTIDLYQEDLTKFAGYFTFVLNDTANGVKFTFPVKKDTYVSSPFGPRMMYGSRFHFGTDLKLYTGDTVIAALEGIVRISRYEPGYGNFVVISHPSGIETLYGHLSKRLVEPGTRVKSGELIGLGGNTGRSTGSHLHFEFRFLGEQFDPEKILSFTSNQVVFGKFDIQAEMFQHLAELREAKYHRIRSGDTLGAIARRYGASISALCRLNGISTRTVLRIGRSLRVN
jgi:murein DD-endopeptidase MepM/ murein hydrolase activator NlpD